MKLMNKGWMLWVVLVGLLVAAQGVRAESNDRIGVGVNYWRTLDNIDISNFDENGISWLATYQHKLADLIKVEADLEMYSSGFLGIDKTVYAPEAYLVVGSTIYGAIGAGIFYADSDFADDPFYALRAGLDLEIIPQFYLDLNVNYRFVGTTNLNDEHRNIDTDTMTLGTALRMEF